MKRIFVFGSNLDGIHGKGAALHAAKWHGAEKGVGEGPTGTAYALPTKRTPYEQLSLQEVKGSIERFIAYARTVPGTEFMVTRVGCGLAGFEDDQIAPLFNDAPRNCKLPGVWLGRRYPALCRLIVAGSRTVTDRDAIFAKLDKLTSRIYPSEIVCGGARGPDEFGREWGEANGIAVAEFPADWNGCPPHLKKTAGMVRNAEMSWYGTHLAAFWDGVSPGTKGMIEIAQRDGLVVRVVTLHQNNLAQELIEQPPPCSTI